MDPIQQRPDPPAVSVPVEYSRLPCSCQVTLPAFWGHVVVQYDRRSSLTIQTAVSHMQREDIGVFVPQDSLSQHQVRAVTPSGGGGRVQDQSLVVQRHGAPVLNATEGEQTLAAQRNVGQHLKIIMKNIWQDVQIYFSDIFLTIRLL